ncbi:hypothetical protein BDQ17DRAFT_1356131 [Cyathus striatus]|nr:hypothetical protein BDQ17DRAFT_1356131 [Cyathus striatus]
MSSQDKPQSMTSKLVSTAIDTFHALNDAELHHAHNSPYSTIRHTRPWVYYRGLYTLVPISILGTKILPPHRLTLQKRGWRTGLLGWTMGSWIGGTVGKEVDVTPDTVLPWNGDYNGKEGKVEGKKKRQYASEIATLAPEGHKVLETDIIHIPVSSGDGYFRILVYPSNSHTPIASTSTFRVGSLSLASACPRGASPITLLPEFALKSASLSGSALAWGTFYTFFPFLKIAEMVPGTHSWGSWALRRAYELAGGDEKVEEAKERLKVEERRREIEKGVYRNVPFGSMGVRTVYDLEEDEKRGKGGVMFTKRE